MSYVRFMNGNNPIWDFISEMTNQGQEPFDRRHGGPPRGSWGWSPFDDESGERGPWSRDMPHRPHHPHHPRGRHGHEHRGPPPPPEYAEDARSTTLQADDDTPINLVNNEQAEHNDEKTPVPDPDISTPDDDDAEAANGAEGAETSGDEHRHRGCHGRRGRHGPHAHPPGFGHGHPFGRRGGFGGHGRGGMRGCRGDPRGSWGPWAGGHPHHHHPYGPPPHHRRWGSGPPPAGPASPFAPWAEMFGIDLANFEPERMREVVAEALQTAASRMHPNNENARASNNDNNNTETETETGEPVSRETSDFRPAADIYDAPTEYIVHFALPGAKKEDISLNWDAEKSELHVAGIIAREGDEEVMKTLALDERDVGCFERKVKLGREGVDAEGISAKMENGLLVVRVPKKVEEDWMEVRKVDIE